MSDLSPDTRALLDAARDAHDPSVGDRARVRGKIATRIGAAAFGTTVAVTATSSTARAAAKVGIGVVVGGALLVVGMWWRSGHEPSAPPPPAANPIVAAPAVTTAPVVDLDPAPVPVESLAPAPSNTVEKKLPSLAPTDNVQSTLDAELALLRDAKKSLNDGDAAHSLALLDEHQRKFPNGILVEERASTRIYALCAAGKTVEARASTQDFLAKYPRSPSAPRVRTSCGAQ
jgi:hypothetical protein